MQRARAFAAAGAAGLAVFLLALVDLALAGPLSAADAGGSAAARALAAGTLGFWRLVSVVGEWTIMIPLLLAALFRLVRRGARREAAALVAVAVAAEAGSLLLKALIARERPDSLAAAGFAFPSGHAGRAAYVATLAAWLAARDRPVSAAVVAAGAAWVALVAASRVALGAHWPSDVVAGAGLGLAIAGFGVALAERGRPRTAAPDHNHGGTESRSRL